MRVILAMLGMLMVPAPALAQDIDLHQFWDQRCAECHGHAGSFAREFLRSENGRLIGHHHVDNLREFLAGHHMDERMAARVETMLTAQVATKPVFREKCARCHGSAADLVRTAIDEKDGVLAGRKRGVPLTLFLARHAGGVAATEIEVLIKSLTRIREETSGTGRSKSPE